jgi:hypothetical protein
MRFSIKTLLAATALVAASISGLLYANAVWAACFYTGAALVVVIGVTAALVRRGPTQAYWVGFALFGAGYLFLSTTAEGSGRVRRDAITIRLEPQLATARFLSWAHQYMPAVDETSPRPQGAASQQVPFGLQPAAANNFGPQRRRHFVQIGHSLFTLLFALVGGSIGRSLYQPANSASQARPTLPP